MTRRQRSITGVKISKDTVLTRTKRMLRKEWTIPSHKKVLSDTPLRGGGKGLSATDNQIIALETPIEAGAFYDVKAEVIGTRLVLAKTVADLRDKIWDGIPEKFKQ